MKKKQQPKFKTIKVEDLWPGDYVRVRMPGRRGPGSSKVVRFSHFASNVTAVVEVEGERMSLYVPDMANDEVEVLL